MAAQRFRFIADAPDLSEVIYPDAPGVEEEPTPPISRVQIAKQGKFRHPKYGNLAVTPKTLDSFAQNFAIGVPTDKLPVDFDHVPDYGGSTEACGWITALEVEGDGLYATVEWRWDGAYAIRDKAYRYVSPTWSLAYTDEAGEKHGPTILAFGLTNRPFFRLPAVSLSQSFSLSDFTPAEEVTDVPDPASDSRAGMEFSAQIREALGLDADADEAAVLTAAKEATASPEGDQIVLDGETYDSLKTAADATGQVLVAKDKASEGEQALARIDEVEQKLSDQEFEVAFQAALTDSDGPKVAPAEKDELHELFKLNRDAFDKVIALRQPVVSTHSQGGRGQEVEVPEGTDPEAAQLHARVQAYMAEHKVDYRAAHDAVVSTEVAA